MFPTFSRLNAASIISGRAGATQGKGLTQTLRRSKDPLLSSPHAQHFQLENGNAFIVREPSSSLPPTLPYPSTSSNLESKNIFTAQSNPFLTPSTSEHLLPPSRTSPSTEIPNKILTLSEIESLQSLRRSNPNHYTRSVLAKQFGISATVVGRLGWGESKEAKVEERRMKALIAQETQQTQDSWGWKKSIAKEERERRRSLW